ncbi:MAG: hypothetical protein HZA91_10160 [Verrucomicrobia bacterium]|nr:hypothetical protein [Verrucomicrobiota bacterium]
MKLVVLRSERSGQELRPEDHYLQQFDTHYADRVIGNLRGEPGYCTACADACVSCREPYRRNFGRDIAGVIGFPDVLPYVLEHPEHYVPKTVPAHDVVLAIHVHEQILLEFLKRCRDWGTRGVVVPLEAPGWVSNGARTRAFELCEAQGVEIAFPKPLCGFKPPEGGVLADFRRHFHIGQPEVALEVKDRVITKADVKASAACGATYYIARWLVGRSLDDDLVTEVISKRMSSFPCTASMEKDAELHNDTPMHMAVQAHHKILAPVKETKGAPALEPDRILTPMGVWIPKPVAPADSAKNIERAKELILAELRRHPAAGFEQLCKAGNASPAAIVSALLLLKKEGRIKAEGGKTVKDQVWRL